MSFEIVVSDQVRDFLRVLDTKTKRICKNNLLKLVRPYPGEGTGDKEKLIIGGEIMYRLHISRTYTAFYISDDKNNIVRVIELLTIEKAHKKYKYR